MFHLPLNYASFPSPSVPGLQTPYNSVSKQASFMSSFMNKLTYDTIAWPLHGTSLHCCNHHKKCNTRNRHINNINNIWALKQAWFKQLLCCHMDEASAWLRRAMCWGATAIRTDIAPYQVTSSWDLMSFKNILRCCLLSITLQLIEVDCNCWWKAAFFFRF